MLSIGFVALGNNIVIIMPTSYCHLSGQKLFILIILFLMSFSLESLIAFKTYHAGIYPCLLKSHTSVLFCRQNILE